MSKSKNRPFQTMKPEIEDPHDVQGGQAELSRDDSKS